jgi:hypothetical protein
MGGRRPVQAQRGMFYQELLPALVDTFPQTTVNYQNATLKRIKKIGINVK